MTRTQTVRVALVASVTVALLALSAPAWAIPRYSARYEQNCGLCHVNPTGGGQRTAYAAQYIAPKELSALSLASEALANLDPQLGKNVTIGLDGRTSYHHGDSGGTGYENFLQMQGAIDLTFQVDPRFLAHVTRELSGSSEVYALGYLLPFNGYVKVGQFVPAYGWRFDDHTMFVRQKTLVVTPGVGDLGGRTAPLQDVGVELAIFPQRLALTASVLNGNPGFSADNNNKMAAYCAQAIYRTRLGRLGMALGGSFWRNYENGGRRTSGGPYGYLRYGPLVWLAETDWSHPEIPGGSGSASGLHTTWTVSQELSCAVHRGVELLARYDFHDPNYDAKTGTRSRYGAGATFMPYPLIAVEALFDHHHFESGAEVSKADYQDFNEAQLQLHFFY